jgi:hypothetical protein
MSNFAATFALKAVTPLAQFKERLAEVQKSLEGATAVRFFIFIFFIFI